VLNNFAGDEYFEYRVTDAHGGTATARADVKVIDKNQPPTAVDDTVDTYSLQAEITLSPMLNDSDVEGDPISIIAVTEPQHGKLLLNADSTLTYLPNERSYTGTDSFTYTLSDGREGGEVTATVTMNIKMNPAIMLLILMAPLF